jgi:hypothetical protein
MLLAWTRKIILQQNLPTAVVPTSMSSISRALAAGTIALVTVQTLRHRRQPGECERSAQRLLHHQNLTLSNTMGH